MEARDLRARQVAVATHVPQEEALSGGEGGGRLILPAWSERRIFHRDDRDDHMHNILGY